MTDQEYDKYVELLHVIGLTPYPKEELEKMHKAHKSWWDVVAEEEDNKFLEVCRKIIKEAE